LIELDIDESASKVDQIVRDTRFEVFDKIAKREGLSRAVFVAQPVPVIQQWVRQLCGEGANMEAVMEALKEYAG